MLQEFEISNTYLLYFQISENYQDSTIVTFGVFYEYPVKGRLFWTQEKNPEIVKISKFPKHIVVINICIILAKRHLCFCYRYWSHIHDFGNVFRRIFIMFRCPPFQQLTKSWKSRYVKRCFQNVSLFFVNFLKCFGVIKS